MRATYGNWRLWAVRAAGVAVATLGVCGPAHAFYWYDWPGSRIRVQQTLIITPHQDASGNPPVLVSPLPPPGTSHVPPPPIGPPVPIDKPPVGPNPTPEPATGLLGLIGLSAVAAVRRWRSKKVMRDE